MSDFHESECCKTGANCGDCRGLLSFRQLVLAGFDSPTDENFPCPYGMTGDNPVPPDSIFSRAKYGNQARAKREMTELAGEEIDTTPEVKASRLAACAGCPHGQLAQGDTVCKHDSLLLEDKCGWLTESCPYGEWS